MKLTINNYQENKTYQIEEDIDFSNADLSKVYNLKKINSCNFKGELTVYEDFLVIEFVIKTNVTLISSYSLKEFDKNMVIKDSIDFAFESEDEFDDVIKGPYLELDKYILDFIVTSIPSKVTMKNEKLPDSGNGYQILSEEESLNKQKDKKDSRWDKLDELVL